MGLFSTVKSAAAKKQQVIQEAYEDGMSHFMKMYAGNPQEDAMASFEYCVEKFDELHKKGDDAEKGYFMAASRWSQGDILSQDDALTFLEHVYDECEFYHRIHSLNLIMRPLLKKRGVLCKDDVGRWIKSW